MVLVGRVRRAFGLKGELVVQPITNEPGAVFAPGRRVFATADSAERFTAGAAPGAVRGPADSPGDGERRACIVQSSRPFKDAWLVKLDCVSDKTEADRWRGVQFQARLDELDPPGENEVYLHEIVGMIARDPHGAVVGEVEGYYEVPQGIILEIRTPRGLRDVPFNEAFVRSVDRVTRVMQLDAPDGLLD